MREQLSILGLSEHPDLCDSIRRGAEIQRQYPDISQNESPFDEFPFERGCGQYPRMIGHFTGKDELTVLEIIRRYRYESERSKDNVRNFIVLKLRFKIRLFESFRRFFCLEIMEQVPLIYKFSFYSYIRLLKLLLFCIYGRCGREKLSGGIPKKLTEGIDKLNMSEDVRVSLELMILGDVGTTGGKSREVISKILEISLPKK